METISSSQGVNTLIDNFAGFGPNKKGPFHNAIIVVFNMDTTNQNIKINEICQIAAWCEGNTFKECMLPNNGISQKASSIHGFRVVERKLLHNGNVVNALSPKEGLEKFLVFLGNLTGQTRKVLLAAHGCTSSQRYVIVRHMKLYGLLDNLQSLVLGFIDTIAAFKSILPERVQEGKSFGLEELTKDYLDVTNIPEQKHAVVNVDILVKLIQTIGCTDAVMTQHSEDFDELIRYIDLKKDFKGEVTDSMLKKIAKAGLSTDSLKDAYNANGGEGVSYLLREEVAGKARVTKDKKVIQKVNARLSELLHSNDGNAN